MKLDYGLYMAEQEGYLDTRESQINAVIKECRKVGKNGKRTIYFAEFNDILRKHGLSYAELTPDELDRIQCG